MFVKYSCYDSGLKWGSHRICMTLANNRVKVPSITYTLELVTFHVARELFKQNFPYKEQQYHITNARVLHYKAGTESSQETLHYHVVQTHISVSTPQEEEPKV